MSQERTTLTGSRRQLIGRKARALRKQGLVPAVLYGYNVLPTSLQVNTRDFEAVYKRAGKTSLVDLQVDEARMVRVFVQDVQRHPISDALQHVDFHAVNLREEITAEVPVVLHGEPAAVHNNLGVLLRGLETVTVHALPANLPHQIEISVEELAEVDQAIHVSDLPTSNTYQITTDGAEMLAKIVHQQLEPEVEEEPAEEAADAEAGAEEPAAEQG